MTATQKKRAVVICPGRGTYNKEELGYFHRLHGDKMEILHVIDNNRSGKGQVSVAELDQMDKYNMRLHTSGENASSLIYACSKGDFEAINQDEFEVVAVTGNSMGWYIALAVAGALSAKDSIELINTMGSMMKDGVIGGQMIYPIVDENWHEVPKQIAQIEQWVEDVKQIPEAELYTSIRLGGFIVFGGNKIGLAELEKRLPPLQDRYPMNLFNHAAFHTPMLEGTSNKAKKMLPASMFDAPKLPMIDGEGNIWQPYSTDVNALWDYTLGTQVKCAYDFSKAIEVAIKEFAPDKLIILGPGATLGGAVAQCLIKHNWQGMSSKADFIATQKSDPYVLAMGMEEQRKLVV